jgi:hypothetical protein
MVVVLIFYVRQVGTEEAFDDLVRDLKQVHDVLGEEGRKRAKRQRR